MSDGPQGSDCGSSPVKKDGSRPDPAPLILPVILSVMTWAAIATLVPSPPPVKTLPPVVTFEEPPSAPEVSSAPYLNATVLLAAVGVSGTLFVLLLKKRPSLASLLSAALYLLVTGSSMSYLLLSSGHVIAGSVSLTLLLSYGLGALCTYLIRRRTGLAAAVSGSITGALGGLVIASVVPPFTSLVLMGAAALFDLLMVWRGYLSAMRALPSEGYRTIRGMVVEMRDASVGLGDLIFYAMAISVSFRIAGLTTAVAVNAVVIAGYYATLAMLRRWDQVPGLSIPLGLSLVLLVLRTYLF
ncbi:MAG: hypothetical protein QXP81_06735 [Nitrososphaerota archaeon]